MITLTIRYSIRRMYWCMIKPLQINLKKIRFIPPVLWSQTKKPHYHHPDNAQVRNRSVEVMIDSWSIKKESLTYFIKHSEWIEWLSICMPSEFIIIIIIKQLYAFLKYILKWWQTTIIYIHTCIVHSSISVDLRCDENSIRFVSNNSNNECVWYCCFVVDDRTQKKSILLCIIMKSSQRTWMKHNNKSFISILIWYRKPMCNEMLKLLHIKTNWRWWCLFQFCNVLFWYYVALKKVVVC